MRKKFVGALWVAEKNEIDLKNLVQGFVLLPSAETGCPNSLSSALSQDENHSQ